MTTTLYTSAQLSNERYHSSEFPQASGSQMAEIIDTCPAEYIGAERKESAALINGTGLHCCVLEPKLFKETYARGIDASEYPEALVTGKDLEVWCRDAGIKGFSGKKKEELIAFIQANSAGENVQIFDVIVAEHEAANAGKTILKPDAYDMVIKMRSALKKFGYVFTPEMQMEVSCISENLKCRWDILVPSGAISPDGTITKNGEIWDLKSTVNVKPEKFGLQSEKCFYWLKMALQHDLYEQHFGVAPDRVVLLAQRKTPPYLPQAYKLTRQQLEAGRDMYMGAYEYLQECKSSGVWPGYGGGVIDLPTSGRAAYEFGFEDEIEIIEG